MPVLKKMLVLFTREWKPLSGPQNAVSLQSAENSVFQKADSPMPFSSLLCILILPLVFVSNSKILEDLCFLNQCNLNQTASCYTFHSYFVFSFS